MQTRVVVIGASGHFGSRFSRRFVGQPGTELVVASRRKGVAEALAEELQELDETASVSAAALDQDAPGFPQDLRRLEADIVVHTAGPYQGQDYRVAEACIACGSHYIDLADGREFVGEFRNLHGRALEKGVLLVSGASTLPGVSSAVVDHVRSSFSAIRSIQCVIAPAHQTPRGTGTTRAVLSYCGRPFDVLEEGEWVTRYGWQDLRMQRFAELKNRLSAACDVPDLVLLPRDVHGLRTATFHAALEAPWEHMALWSMAWLVRIGIVKDWRNWIPTIRWLNRKLIRWGSATGGMQMRIAGTGHDGRERLATWNLTAKRNHGPEIPCVPALVLARKLASGRLEMRGAYPCLGMITLDEFDEETRDLDIHWSFDDVAST